MIGDDSFSFPHTPTDIRLKRAEKVLEVIFDDSSHFSFSAEFLRVHSPSAGTGPFTRGTPSCCGRRHVGILGLELVGKYALRIEFDDLHDSGIYSWRVLYHFGLRQESLWARYLKEMADLGLSRDP